MWELSFLFRLTSSRHDSWIRALGRNPTKEYLSVSNCFCDVQFLDDKILMNKKIRLRPGAVPQHGLKPVTLPQINTQKLVHQVQHSFGLVYVKLFKIKS